MGAVAKLIIAATTDAEMRYAAGLSLFDPSLLLDTGKRTLLLSSLEYGRAKRILGRKKGYEVVLLDPYYERVKEQLQRKKGQKVRKGSVLALIAAEFLKRRRIRKVVMPGRAWASHVEQLRKAGIRVEVSARPLYPERAVKTKEEIREIMKVRKAAVKAMNHCLALLKRARIGKRNELHYKGKLVTAELLRREARHILLEHDCEAQDLIVSHGRQTAFPHEMGSGVIKAGEPIILDFFPRSRESGYWFDMTRTVVKGTPTSWLRKLYATVKKAQDAALARVKAGATTGAIHDAAARACAAAGYATNELEGYLHSTGHGVGLEIHEAPSLHQGGRERLKAGMVLTVEPGLYYKQGGVRLENTVLVTTTGYRDLTRAARVLRL